MSSGTCPVMDATYTTRLYQFGAEGRYVRLLSNELGPKPGTRTVRFNDLGTEHVLSLSALAPVRWISRVRAAELNGEADDYRHDRQWSGPGWTDPDRDWHSRWLSGRFW